MLGKLLESLGEPISYIVFGNIKDIDMFFDCVCFDKTRFWDAVRSGDKSRKPIPLEEFLDNLFHEKEIQLNEDLKATSKKDSDYIYIGNEAVLKSQIENLYKAIVE